MKKNIIKGVLLLFLIQSVNLSAQLSDDENESHKFYLGLGGGYGFDNAIYGFSGSFLSKSNWGFSLSYKLNEISNPVNLPSDFETFGLCHLGDCTPKDFLTMFTLSLIKDFPIADSRGKISIEAGPAWSSYNLAQFEKDARYFIFRFDYYDISYLRQKTLGFFLRLSRKVFFSKNIGMEIAGLANLNKRKSFVGMELYLTVGKVQ